MIVFNPIVLRDSIQSSCPELILEKAIDSFYDTLNKCYKNQMSSVLHQTSDLNEIIYNYVSSINNEEGFDYWYNNLNDWFNDYDKKHPKLNS